MQIFNLAAMALLAATVSEAAAVPQLRSLPEAATLPEAAGFPKAATLLEAATLPETVTLPEKATVPEEATMPEEAAVPEVAPVSNVAEVSDSGMLYLSYCKGHSRDLGKSLCKKRHGTWAQRTDMPSELKSRSGYYCLGGGFWGRDPCKKEYGEGFEAISWAV
jgi:hypothetical protein